MAAKEAAEESTRREDRLRAGAAEREDQLRRAEEERASRQWRRDRQVDTYYAKLVEAEYAIGQRGSVARWYRDLDDLSALAMFVSPPNTAHVIDQMNIVFCRFLDGDLGGSNRVAAFRNSRDLLRLHLNEALGVGGDLGDLPLPGWLRTETDSHRSMKGY